MAQFYVIFVHFIHDVLMWRPLAIVGVEDVVLQRLASNHEFHVGHIVLSISWRTQPHVHFTLLYLASLGLLGSDMLTTERQIHMLVVHSFIDVMCNCYTWALVFGAVIHIANIQHTCSIVVLGIRGYNILRTFIFYARGYAFLIGTSLAYMQSTPAPFARSNLFVSCSWRGHSLKAPRLHASFMWDCYLWHPIHCLYETTGPIMLVFVPALWCATLFFYKKNMLLYSCICLMSLSWCSLQFGCYHCYITSSIKFDSNVPIWQD